MLNCVNDKFWGREGKSMYKIVQNTTIESKYAFVVVSTSYIDPLEEIWMIEQIEREIGVQSKNCSVLFDLLACLGDNSERFISLYFDGEHFDLNTVEFVDFSKKSVIRDVSKNVLLEMADGLDNTMLNTFQKRILQSGISI